MNLDAEIHRPSIQTGRVDTGLGPLQIQVVDSAGSHMFDPNTIKIAVFTKTLKLAKPIGPSDISGEPGYIYRTHDVQILLTKAELCRLVTRELHPAEALGLLKRFGDFFEIHEDFYDPQTGEALQ